MSAAKWLMQVSLGDLSFASQGQGRKALLAVCGPVWRVLRAGGRLPLRHRGGPLWPAEGGGVAVSCSVFKVLISTGRRLTPPVPMGYTHERPPRYRDSDVGAAGLAPAAACGRRPCGLGLQIRLVSAALCVCKNIDHIAV